jgi:protein-disulfide isomerase
MFSRYIYCVFPMPSMKKFFATAITLTFALQPLAALAAFDTPDALSAAVNGDTAPRTVTGQIHAHAKLGDDLYLSVWFSGAQAGSLATLATDSATFSATVDVSDTTTPWSARLKGEMKFVNGTGYVNFSTLTFNQSSDKFALSVQGLLKKWIAIPDLLSDINQDSSGSPDLGMLFNGNLSGLSDTFQMTSSALPHGGTRYSLMPTVAFLQGLGIDLSSIPDGKTLSDAVNIHVLTDLDSQNRFMQSKAYAAFALNDMDGVLTATVTRATKPLTVTAPTNTMTLDEFQQSFDTLGLGSALMGSPSDSGSMPVDNGSSMDNSSSSDQNSSSDMTVTPSSTSISTNGRPSPQSVRDNAAAAEKARLLQHSRGSSQTYAPVGDYTPALPAKGLSEGSALAPVTIVEFTDYGCPFCAQFAEQTLPLITSQYIAKNKVRFVVRNFPMSFHPAANVSAMAVECARDQSDMLAWQLHNLLLAKTAERNELTQDDVYAALKAIPGFDLQKMYYCIDTAAKQPLLDLDKGDAVNGGINGTPSFWVLGPKGKAELIQGAVPFETFQKVIDTMLAK